MDTQAEELFGQALDLDPADRQQFVAEACAGNHGLRHLVEQLLMDVEGADAYFTAGAGGASWIGPANNFILEQEGDWVGPYKLLELLGEGGFGVVWMAEQSKPISRRVAVKVIKAGMDTKEVLSRFDAERQALARMNHPNIARVLDAGVTLTGRPYFAMELVKGVHITRFGDDQQLDVSARLLLFGDVCAAINHAHQKGVIHRDIKPSNVLVTLDGDKPQVKVIDFGISKAIEGRLTDGTLFTRLEQFVGTPVYMSPEQAGLGGLDIDTRSDIYALGVLLYELLTGVPPFDQATLMQAGYEEMRRIIREVEPLRPSLRLTTQHADQSAPISATRQLTEGRHNRIVATDLDWIVMKAIDKSRDRRYDTAAALADDIGRFLADEPVTAKPPSASYLLSKFAKRHRAGFQVTCGIGILLVGTVVFSTWQALRATKAEALAGQRMAQAVVERNAKDSALQDARSERNAKDSALQDAQAVSRLLIEVFQRPDPAMDGRKVTVVDALDAASAKLNTALVGQPERLAMLLDVLAGTYEQLGQFQKSLDLQKRALEIRRGHFGLEHPDTLQSMRSTIQSYLRIGQYADARDLAEQELVIRWRIHGSNDEETLKTMRYLATGYFSTGERDKAIATLTEVIKRAGETIGENSQTVISDRWLLAHYYRAAGNDKKADEVEKMTSSTISPRSSSHPSNPSDSEYCAMRSRYIETTAEKLATSRRELGPSHVKCLELQSLLADQYCQIGQPAKAVPLQEDLVAMNREKYGEKHYQTLNSEQALVCYLNLIEQWDRAKSLAKVLLAKQQANYSPEHRATLYARGGQVLGLFNLAKFTQGITLGEEVVPLLQKVAGPRDRGTLDVSCHLARCYTSVGRTREAINLLNACAPHMDDDTFVNHLLAGLQLWFRLADDYEKTRAQMLKFAHINRDDMGTRHDILQRSILICCLAPLADEAQGKELLATLKCADEIRQIPNLVNRYWSGPAWYTVITGICCYRTGDWPKAITTFDESLRIAEMNKADENEWVRLLAGYYKSMALFQMGEKNTGKELFQATTRSMKSWPSDEHPLMGNKGSSGEVLTYWLAYKEAKGLFEQASPPTQ